jgi:molybdopterin molybdotransferase
VSLGIQEVTVYAKPSCAIISTGDELVPIGSVLSKGKIYESNAPMLANALKTKGFDDIALFHVKDDSQSTYNLLKEAIEHFDYLLISGGVSVGDYDFVAQSLIQLGVQQHFHKVKQKPGKPLFYGTFQNKKIFGLPGNPAAALTLFYIYVLPSIHYSIGRNFLGLRKTSLKSISQLSKPENRAQFLKALADESKGTVEILEGQSSAMLQTFALANAIVYLDENELIEKGESVCVYYL